MFFAQIGAAGRGKRPPPCISCTAIDFTRLLGAPNDKRIRRKQNFALKIKRYRPGNENASTIDPRSYFCTFVPFDFFFSSFFCSFLSYSHRYFCLFVFCSFQAVCSPCSYFYFCLFVSFVRIVIFVLLFLIFSFFFVWFVSLILVVLFFLLFFLLLLLLLFSSSYTFVSLIIFCSQFINAHTMHTGVHTQVRNYTRTHTHTQCDCSQSLPFLKLFSNYANFEIQNNFIFQFILALMFFM